MLVPREVFDAKAAPALMRINGMEPTERECILISDPQQPVIALMAADKASVEKVRARLKEKIRWTSPLLRTGEFTASCLWIFRYEELAYLKYGNGKPYGWRRHSSPPRGKICSSTSGS